MRLLTSFLAMLALLAGCSTVDVGRAPVLAPNAQWAVLPFANRSAQEGDIFFVDGIHDDILTQLARIGSLTVISNSGLILPTTRKPLEKSPS